MPYHELFKCMGDPLKLRVLSLLLEGPLCVCHIHELLGESQPKVSKCLNSMKDAGWLISCRHLNWSIYQIDQEGNPLIGKILPIIEELRKLDPSYSNDLRRRTQILAQTASEKKECPLSISGEIRNMAVNV